MGNNPEANTPTILAQRSLKPTLLKLKPIVANPSVHDANAISRGLFLQSFIIDGALCGFPDEDGSETSIKIGLNNVINSF